MSSTPPLANWPFVVLWPAIFWAAASFVLWLACCGFPWQSDIAAAGATVLAMLGLLTGVLLRLQPLPAVATDHASESDLAPLTEAKWLLSLAVEANAVGCVAVLLRDWAAVLPALSMLMTVELLLWNRAPQRWQTWLASRWATSHHQASSSSLAMSPQSAAQSTDQEALSGTSVLADAELSQASVQGTTSEGQAFQNGWLKIELAANQKSAAYSIAFSSAFKGPPSIDLEIEDQAGPGEDETEVPLFEGDVEVDQATPTGMRVIIRRRLAHEAANYKLLWYAVEAASLSESLLASRLP